MAAVAPPAPILLVEDRDALRAMLRHALEASGYQVLEASDVPGALALVGARRPELVLTDLRLPGGDGFAVLRAVQELDPHLPVIVMTAYGTIRDAVAAMKAGALDFLAKPIEPDHLLLLVERALTERRRAAENLLLKEELAARRGAPVIIGEDPALKRVSAVLQRAADTGTPVLIEGESGTGKELFARRLHALSARAGGPFVPINCAAIPESLLEAELFGYEKGAFTGADARKPGKFELAHRGTLFLDEIGDLALPLQAKILRAIEQQRFERLGGTTSLHVDVRIVSATNRDLRARVAARQFREDLFFRLAVFPVTVPPLRDRRGDIPLLARHFVDRFCRDQNKPALPLSPEASDALLARDWPGNVRELQNCIERAVILVEGGTVEARHVSLPGSGPGALAGQEEPEGHETLAAATRRAVTEVERRLVTGALRRHAGDRQAAAAALDIPLAELAAKMREHGLA